MTRARELAELGSVYDNNTLSHRNVVMNGEFAISQRGTSFTNIGSSGTYDDTFTMDRFLISQGVSAGRCSVEQSSDTPDGFSKSLKISTTTADTSVGAAEYHRLQTKFEGADLQRFAKGTSSAKEYTLSFHCKANAAATYVVELYDQDNQRTVAKTFSVTTNWTKVTLTFPADTTGAFNNDNNLSMELNWWMHAGSTYGGGTLQTTWGSIVQANRAAGIDSIFDSTSRTFFITGVQLEVGDTATPFEHRTFGDELARCERYFYKTYEYATKPGTASSLASSLGRYIDAAQNYASLGLPSVNMRATPTTTIYNPNDGTVGEIRSDSTDHSAVGHSSIGQKGGSFIYVNNDTISVSASTRAHITFEAEI